jgi:KDO2-lipid IV(A) lauroyltransferase
MSKLLRRLPAYPRLRRSVRSGKTRLIEGLARAALWGLGRLSLPQALQLGEAIGGMAYRLLRKPRQLALEHLRIAFGDSLSPAAREHLARASFVNAARTFCEIAKIDEIRAQQESYIEAEGWEHLERVRAQGGGCIAITGHIGNWELLAAYVAWRGVPIAAVARRVYAERLNQLLVGFRQRQGVETILRESPSSARQILRALKSGSVLAMLIDQDTHVPSVYVPFFGRLARTPMAAAALAARRELPVLAAFMQRRGDWGCRVVIRPPIEIRLSGDRQADIRSLTAQFNAAIEAQIRANPAEWVWWHRRWRRAPIARLDPNADLPYTEATAVQHGPS